jgi:hypothetical protein
MILPLLQCCPLDVEAAVELCALIADLEPGKRLGSEFWVVYRKDTPSDPLRQALKHLQAKFHQVHFHPAPNFGEGWPHGSNMLWGSAILLAATGKRENWTRCDGVLTFEPDCVPLRHGWLPALEREWVAGGAEALGHVHQKGEDGEHLNGNAVFATDIATRYPQLMESRPDCGWDYYHRELLRGIARDTALISQQYKVPTTTPDELFSIRKHGQAPALFHGVKDGSARAAVRERLL